LISIRQGLSAEVLDFRSSGNLSLVPHFLNEAVDAPEVLRVVRDLYRLRVAFNLQVASGAARKITADGKRRLLDLLAGLESDRADTPRVMTADIEIYRVLAVQSGSLVHVWTFNSYAPLYLFVMARAPQGWLYPDLYFTHMARVIRAVAAGRPAAAERAMRDLLHRMDKTTFDLLDELERDMKEKGRP
jgi:DNA-binding FadR family transcriptional regulator